MSVVLWSALKTSILPDNTSPIPVINFITSFACRTPIIPGKTPITPDNEQLVVDSSVGNCGNRHRYVGPFWKLKTLICPSNL